METFSNSEESSGEMNKYKMDLMKKDLFAFYKQYSNNLLNESKNYKENDFDDNDDNDDGNFDGKHKFYFTNKTEFIKSTKFNRLQNDKPLDHLLGVLKDCNRETIYNYKNNEFEYINWFYTDLYKKEEKNLKLNTTLHTTYSNFCTSLNKLIHTYFTTLPYIEIDKDDIHKLINLKAEPFLTYIGLSELSPYFKLLLYRIQLLHQSVSAYIIKFFNISELFISLSSEKIIIFNPDLNCMSLVSYLNCSIELNDAPIHVIIGKVIVTSKMENIDEYAYSIFELNFDFKINDIIIKTNNIEKSNLLRKAIVEYLSRIHSKTGSINILQCLADKSIKPQNTHLSILPARSIGEPKYINTSGFYKAEDVTGTNEIFTKSECYNKTMDSTKPNKCTYNGLLNYYKCTGECYELNVNCENPKSILDQIYKFFLDFNNIASSLIIVTDIYTIENIFGKIVELTKSLEFIIFSSDGVMLYKLYNDNVEYRPISLHLYDSENIKNLQKNIKPYQHVYIIVQCDYDREIMPALYDPPISTNDLNLKMQLFIDIFKSIYKNSLPVIATSYLSRAILTASLINLALPDTVLGWSNNNNIDLTLQVFMLIYFIRNLKLNIHNSKVHNSKLKGTVIEGRDIFSFMPSSTPELKIGNLNISTNSGLKAVVSYVNSLKKNFVDKKIELIPDDEIKRYMKLYIEPLDYKKLFLSQKLMPDQDQEHLLSKSFKGGFINKLTKSQSRKTRKPRKNSHLTKRKTKKLTKRIKNKY